MGIPQLALGVFVELHYQLLEGALSLGDGDSS